jgi:pyruvate dehydrogenase E2 component (dihydrolipoamide acetyltransferase)
VFGVDGSAAIINYPEVAILGMGRIIDRPWVVDGLVASVRRRLHRIARHRHRRSLAHPGPSARRGWSGLRP